MKSEDAVYLVVRYFLLIFFGLFNLAVIYAVFTPLTIYPLYLILSAVDSSTKLLGSNLFFFSSFYAEIIPACIAGAAYYLLLILNLSTPMKIKQRVKSLGFLFLVFLFLNIARILIFLTLWKSGYEYFNTTHLFFWYFGSTVLVIAVWFLNVSLFKIKTIPLYTDVKNLFEEISSGKRKTKKRKNSYSKRL